MTTQKRTRALFGVLAICFIMLGAVALPAAAQDDPVTVRTTNNLNMRDFPGPQGEILTVIPYDTVVTATAINPDRTGITVSYEEQSGWVALAYVSVESGSLAALPVDDPAANFQQQIDEATSEGQSAFDALVDLWESLNTGSDSTGDGDSNATTDTLTITTPYSGVSLPANSLKLEWLPVAGAASYRIDVYSDQVEIAYNASYRTAGTVFQVPMTDLPARANGWGYWIEVTALDGSGQTIASARIWGARYTVASASSAPAGPPRPRP